jgi:hypothetical protein
MINIFYLFSIVAIIWEIMVVRNPIKISKFIGSYNNKETVVLTKKQKSISFCMLGYLIWCILGLFTGQWILFLLLLILGLFPKKVIILTFINGLISLFLLVFIVLNVYHLHFDLVSIIRNWF